MFELGARWGAKLSITPLLTGGVRAQELISPLAVLQCVVGTGRAHLSQMLEQVRHEIGGNLQPMNTYDADLNLVTQLACGGVDFSAVRALCQNAAQKH